jgi:hypothetical protein
MFPSNVQDIGSCGDITLELTAARPFRAPAALSKRQPSRQSGSPHATSKARFQLQKARPQQAACTRYSPTENQLPQLPLPPRLGRQGHFGWTEDLWLVQTQSFICVTDCTMIIANMRSCHDWYRYLCPLYLWLYQEATPHFVSSREIPSPRHSGVVIL